MNENALESLRLHALRSLKKSTTSESEKSPTVSDLKLLQIIEKEDGEIAEAEPSLGKSTEKFQATAHHTESIAPKLGSLPMPCSFNINTNPVAQSISKPAPSSAIVSQEKPKVIAGKQNFGKTKVSKKQKKKKQKRKVENPLSRHIPVPSTIGFAPYANRTLVFNRPQNGTHQNHNSSLTSLISPDTSTTGEPADTKPSFVIELDDSEDDVQIAEDGTENMKEQRMEDLKSQLVKIDESFESNEAMIKNCVEKQTALKQKLKEYKTIIEKCKGMKEVLLTRKLLIMRELEKCQRTDLQMPFAKRPILFDENSELFSDKSPAAFSETVCESNVVRCESVLATEISIESGEIISDGSPPTPVSLSSKRTAELAELDKQLNKVKKEMLLSKMAILEKQKNDLKRLKRLSSPKKNTKHLKFSINPSKMLADIMMPCKEDLPRENDLAIPDNIGSHLVSFSGTIVPLQILEDVLKDCQLNNVLPVIGEDKCPQLEPITKSSQSYAAEYESPLRWFKLSIFLPFFLDFVPKKGLLSPTFMNKIDPLVIFCKDEFPYGCSNRNCSFQHLSKVTLNDEEILKQFLNRLLSYDLSGKFENQEAAVKYIEEQVLGKSNLGVPIVSIANKLKGLKTEISGNPLCIASAEGKNSEPATILHSDDIKSIDLQIRAFISAVNCRLDVPMFEFTKAIIEQNFTSLFRCFQSADESLSLNNELMTIVEKLDGVDRAESSNEFIRLSLELLDKRPRFEILRFLVADCMKLSDRTNDLRAFLSISILQCPESVALKWLSFNSLENSDPESLDIAVQIILASKNSEALTAILLALSKLLIETGKFNEVRAIFLSVLEGQMSLQFEDSLPCAQLCALPFELDFGDLVTLWLFYLEFINTDTYQCSQFFSNPFSSIPNPEHFTLVSWSRKKSFAFGYLALIKLLEMDAKECKKQKLCVLYNLFALRLFREQPNDIIDSFSNLEEFSHELDLLRRFFSFPSLESLDYSKPLSVAYVASKINSLNMKRLALDILNSFWKINFGLSADDINGEDLRNHYLSGFNLIVHSVQCALEERLDCNIFDDVGSEDALFLKDLLVRVILRPIVFDLPYFLKPREMEHCAFASLLTIGPVVSRPVLLKASFTACLDYLRSNPTDKDVWKMLYELALGKGIVTSKHFGKLMDLARQFCPYLSLAPKTLENNVASGTNHDLF